MDPAFYKLTKKSEYSVLSVIPRHSIVVGQFANIYLLKIGYKAPGSVQIIEGESRLAPYDLIVNPELNIMAAETSTRFRVPVSSYSVCLNLPEDAELRRSSVACTVDQNIIRCEGLGESDLKNLELIWREKSVPEKLMRKGWPWFILAVKNSIFGLFGVFK